MAKGGIIKHKVADDGLAISLRWFDFRKKHNITWVKKTRTNGAVFHSPTWPQDCLDFFKDNKVTYALKGNGAYAKTPDGRTVEMKDITFSFPSKDIAALFKISYL